MENRTTFEGIDVDDHHFGGHWTRLKLDTVDDYLGAWLQVMSNQPFERIYIDAFAGSGKVRLRQGDEVISGSAERALMNHRFDRYFFFERNRRRAKQLRALAARHGKADRTEVHQGDANALALSHEARFSAPSVRGVMFLDPYGLQIEWSMLEAIARMRTMDVWYLFPLSGFYRQAALSSDRIDRAKEMSLDRLLGTTEWRQVLYSPPPQGQLFDVPIDERTHDAVALQAYARERLHSVFPLVETPRMLRGANNAPLYSLFFCMSNPSPTAQRIGRRIAGHLLRSG